MSYIPLYEMSFRQLCKIRSRFAYPTSFRRLKDILPRCLDCLHKTSLRLFFLLDFLPISVWYCFTGCRLQGGVQGTAGEVQFLFFSCFLLVLTKCLFWEQGFLHQAIVQLIFEIFLIFFNFLSLKSFGITITNNRISFHLW